MLTAMTEEEWTIVLRVFAASRSRRGDKGRNDRKFLEALHYFVVHNITWRALPEKFGHWNSVWKRFWRLSRSQRPLGMHMWSVRPAAKNTPMVRPSSSVLPVLTLRLNSRGDALDSVIPGLKPGNRARTGQSFLSHRTYTLQLTHAGAIGLRCHACRGSLLHGRALEPTRRGRSAERSQAIRGALRLQGRGWGRPSIRFRPEIDEPQLPGRNGPSHSRSGSV